MRRDWKGASDAELVTAVIHHGSEVASSELFRRHRQKVYIWCFHITHDEEEAVDLTQEVFIRVFKGLSGFDGRSKFSTWLYRVTRNHCLSVVSTRKRKWRRQWAQLDGIEAEDQTFARRLHQTEVAGELDELLAQAGQVMKSEELEAFVLHYRDGLAVKEISRTLRCTNATGARTLIQNARRKFKRLTDRKDGTSETPE